MTQPPESPFSLVLDEMRRQSDLQMRVYEETDRKLVEIVKLDAVLLTVIATAIGIFVTPRSESQPIAILLGAGVAVVAMLGSAVVGVVGYGRGRLAVGFVGEPPLLLGSQDVDGSRRHDAASYREMILRNAAALEAKLRDLTWSMSLFASGASGLALTARGLIASGTW